MMERILISEKGERFTEAQIIFLNFILKLAQKSVIDISILDAQERDLKAVEMPYGFEGIIVTLNSIKYIITSKNMIDRTNRNAKLKVLQKELRKSLAKLYINGVLNLKLF